MSLLTIVLAIQNDRLRKEGTELRRATQFVHKGMWLPSFEGTTVDGDIVRVGGATGQRQILVYLSAACQFCEQSMPFINEMARFSRDYDDLELIGLTTVNDAETRDFIKRHDVQFPMVVVEEARLRNLMRFGPTPAVVNVKASGQVSLVKLGLIPSSKDAALIMLDAVRMEATEDGAKVGG